MATTNQPTSAPSDKLTASTLGTGFATLAYALAAKRYPVLSDKEIMVSALPAFAIVCSYLPGYIKREADELTKTMTAAQRWMVFGGGIAIIIALAVVGNLWIL